MSQNPTAPPPSYDELTDKNSEEISSLPVDPLKSEYLNQIATEVGYNVQLQSNPYAYSQMCLKSPCAPPLPSEIQEIQTQPIVVQPQVIKATGLIANPDGTYDFGPYPCRVVCPECHKTSHTRIEYNNSAFTHLLAGALCLLGCCCLAPVPYCIDSCKNSVHYCGECGKYLGTYINGISVSRYRQYNKYGPHYFNDKCYGPHKLNEPSAPHYNQH